MKSSRAYLFLVLLLSGFVSPANAEPSGATGKHAVGKVSKEQNAKLVELKKARAENEAEIKRLRAKLKREADEKAARRKKQEIKDQKDSLSEMNAADQVALQQAMERKAQLEKMISDVMKASSDTANSISGNLK